MPSVKKTLSKRRLAAAKARISVDPTRLALSAVDRLKALLVRTGQMHKLGPATTMRELVARGNVLGQSLPPSYTAAMKVATLFGDPEVLLDGAGMRQAMDEIRATKAPDVERYVPFARVGEKYVCFDKDAPAHGDMELPVVEWYRGMPKPRARHFGEWLDDVADTREEAVEHAAVIPPSLKNLLVDLGFRFDDPVVGRLETADIPAIEELVSHEQAQAIRGTVDRLFDSSGKASLTLNLDEFTLAVSLRTGIFVFEAEDVFRWLRSFRDESFFGDTPRKPSHPDRARDLRKAPREPPLVLRGVIEMATLPARKHVFRAACGVSANDFYLLGRTASRSDRSPSLILHVRNGKVKEAHALDEPLNDIFITPEGTMWGLSLSGYAIRFAGGHARSFPLYRPTHGRTWWYGIGGGADRILVWGAGALLEWSGEEFVPFSPDAALDENESVPALCATKREIAMLVCGDRVGAVARFDGKKWLPIPVSHVIDGVLADLDVWRGVGIVLARNGAVWRVEDGPPRPVIWDTAHQAFVSENGMPRATHAVRGYDGGALVASDGGVIVVGGAEPVFHSAGPTSEPARLSRVGGGPPPAGRRSRPNMKRDEEEEVGIVAMCGPHAWLWKDGAFDVIDLREW